jgi:hypothetical protein
MKPNFPGASIKGRAKSSTILNRCRKGGDSFPESRTADRHIARLRKRIETDAEWPLTVTVREWARGGHGHRKMIHIFCHAGLSVGR